MVRKIYSLLFIAGFFSLPAQSNLSVTVQVDEWVAAYSQPTNRYGHAVLGETPEWGKLCLANRDAEACVTLPETRVFEDVAPRLTDVNADGRLDAVVVESDVQLGAALVVYQLNRSGRLIRTSSKPIGLAFRWLAPVGIADMDGDGYVEIAYIDRPHLAKTLRILRFIDAQLIEVASKTGLTNHRIGDAYILGGIRTCTADTTELITADSTWTNVMASKFDGEKVTSVPIRPFNSDKDIRDALICF